MALDAIQEPISLFEPVYHDGGDAVYVMDQVSDKKNLDETWIEKISLREAMDKLSEREKMMVSRIPVGRIGQPVEIANMVRYLASDEAQFITGSDMLVDGGALLPALMDNTYIK